MGVTCHGGCLREAAYWEPEDGEMVPYCKLCLDPEKDGIIRIDRATDANLQFRAKS